MVKIRPSLHFFEHQIQKSPFTCVKGLRGRRRPTLPPGVAVPSAQTGLTSLFGMERGVPRRHGHLDLQYLNVRSLNGPCWACRSIAEVWHMLGRTFGKAQKRVNEVFFYKGAREGRASLRAISTARLHASLHFHLQPINVVIFHDPFVRKLGILILEMASHLDAFSAYPDRT